MEIPESVKKQLATQSEQLEMFKKEIEVTKKELNKAKEEKQYQGWFERVTKSLGALPEKPEVLAKSLHEIAKLDATRAEEQFSTHEKTAVLLAKSKLFETTGFGGAAEDASDDPTVLINKAVNALMVGKEASEANRAAAYAKVLKEHPEFYTQYKVKKMKG